MPSAMPFTALPPVTSLAPSPEQTAVGQARTKLEQDQAKPSFTAGLWEKAGQYHAEHPGIIGRLGQVGAGLLRGVDIAGEIAAPNLARAIPGTGLNRWANIQADQAGLSGAEANARTAAETQKDRAEAEKIKNPPATTPKTYAELMIQQHPGAKAEDLMTADVTSKDQKGTAPKANFSNGGELLSVTMGDKQYIPGDPTAPAEAQQIFDQAKANLAAQEQAKNQPISQEEADRFNVNDDKLLAALGLPTGQYRAGMSKTEVNQAHQSITSAVAGIRAQQAMALASQKQQDADANKKARVGTIQNSINELAKPDIVKLFDKPGVGLALANALAPQVTQLKVGAILSRAPVGLSLPTSTLDNFVTRNIISAADAQRLINRYNLAAEAAVQYLVLEQNERIGRGGKALLEPLFNMLPGPKTTSSADAKEKLGLWQDMFDIWKKSNPRFSEGFPSYREQSGGGGQDRKQQVLQSITLPGGGHLIDVKFGPNGQMIVWSGKAGDGWVDPATGKPVQ